MKSNITEQQSYNIDNGKVVQVNYCDYVVMGIVVDSRCMYGVRKQYTIELMHSVDMGFTYKYKFERILVDNTESLEILS